MLLPSPQIVNNAWEWSYGKHDELEFTRLKYCLGGNYIRPDFLDCNNPAGNFPGGIVQVRVILDGNFPVGSYPGWGFFGWEVPGWEFSWVGIVQVEVFLGGNFLWWGLSGWELFGGNLRV